MFGKSDYLLCLFLLIATVGCAAKLHMDVPLVWKPTNDTYVIVTSNLANLYSKKLSIKSFTDKRDNIFEIGMYVEDDKNLAVTTKDNVAIWYTEKFKAIFHQYGLNIVESNPDVILNGEILHLYVTEDKLYNASAGLKITALDPAGNILWQGVTSGTAKRFGRSYKLENYYESLSDAYLEAVQGLLKDNGFIKALN